MRRSMAARDFLFVLMQSSLQCHPPVDERMSIGKQNVCRVNIRSAASVILHGLVGTSTPQPILLRADADGGGEEVDHPVIFSPPTPPSTDWKD